MISSEPGPDAATRVEPTPYRADPTGGPPRTLWVPELQAGDALWHHRTVGIVARVLFTAIFFLSGVTHFTDVPRYVGLMPEPVPFKVFWVLISGAVELAGALSIAFNYRPRLGAWLIVLFLVPVTVAVHGVGIFTAPSEAMSGIQTSMFLKGVSMTGAALFLTQFGVQLVPHRPS